MNRRLILVEFLCYRILLKVVSCALFLELKAKSRKTKANRLYLAPSFKEDKKYKGIWE